MAIDRTAALDRMQGLAGDDYISALKASGLLRGEELDKALSLFAGLSDPFERSGQALGQLLAQHGLLTPWQASALATGLEHGFVLGHYKLLEEIGRGGMGRVYLAEHQLMGRRVAIKVVNKQAELSTRFDRFLIESRASASLDDPHIVRVFHFDQEGTICYLVMEYVAGLDLKRRVERDGPLPFRDAADYIRQAAEGLACMHERGLVHRDVKPGNLLVDDQGCVKVLDLGLARFMSGEFSMTGDSRMLGTADFIAPEQVRNSHRVDHRVDIYGLGGTLYYLLTGQPPFTGCEVFERLHKHLHEEPRDIQSIRPDTPSGLVAICRHLMAKAPEARPQQARGVSAMLARWMESPEGQRLIVSAPGVNPSPARTLIASATESIAGGGTEQVGSAAAAADRSRALTRLAGGTAHRLNNLLQSIEVGVSLALLDLRLDDTARGSLAEVEAGVRAAAELTEQLLIVAGRANFHPAPCKVGELLDEAARWLSASAPAGVEVRRDIAADVPATMGDAAQLRRMLLNLCTNARDALSEREGVITLQAAATRSADGQPEVQLTVSDDGPGMDRETLRQIFDPFFSTRGVERGLGLAVAQGIAQGHGGRIDVSSQPGQGAVIRVHLPALEVAPGSLSMPNPAHTRQTILVVDDDDQLREVTRRLLSRFGYHVLTAKNGADAVDVYRQQAEGIDLVLIDQCMPGLTGEAALRQIRQIRPDVRAIVSSGSTDQATLNRILHLGHVGFIQKPYQTAALADEVKRQLDRSGSESGSA